MDTKNIIIICLAIIVVLLAVSLGFLMGHPQNNHNATDVTNITNTTNTTNTTANTTNVTQDNDNAVSDSSSSESEQANTADSSGSSEPEEIDYNSPDSKYFRYDTDGSYHEKQEGGKYVYAQDAVTGEWSYWADKS